MDESTATMLTKSGGYCITFRWNNFSITEYNIKVEYIIILLLSNLYHFMKALLN